MRRGWVFAVVLEFGLRVAAQSVGAQLPVGSRDVSDHTRTDAANAKLREAEGALERGDFAAAAKMLQVLAVERPRDATILYDLGFAEERSADEAGAAAAYAAAIAADAGMAQARVGLGLLDARNGRTVKARGELATVAEEADAPADLRGRALRAMAQMDADANPAQASDELLRAIELTAETPADTALSAALAAKAGDGAGAESEYRRLLQVRPDDADAAAGLAHLLMQAGKNSEAEAVLEGPLKANPDDPRLISQMAAALAADGKVKQGIPLLERLRAEPKFAGDVGLERQLARLYAIDGQNVEAERLLRALLAAQPEDAAAMDDLGTALVEQQKYAEAQKVLTQAMSLRAKFATLAAFGEAAGHLAFAASKNGQPQVCLQALALRATVLPNSGPSLFLEATAHDTLHQTKEAQRSYRAFLALAGGQYPDEEFEARHRLVALEHMK